MTELTELTEPPAQGLEIDFTIEADNWLKADAVPDLEEMAHAVLHHAAQHLGAAVPANAEVSVVFADDKTVHGLNATWRGQDKPTNVLSFAANDADAPPSPLLGDIVLAYETIEGEAKDQNKPMSAYVSHLLVHGFLHLFGYDHVKEDDAEHMEDVERRILAGLGIADPYAAS